MVEEGIPDLEALQNLLQMTTMQIQYTANRRNQNFKPMKPHDFKVGDLVLVRNHTSKAFQEKYQDSFCVTRLLGKNQLEVKNQNNHVRTVHITDVKKTTMPEVILNAVPDYSQFGRAAKLRLNPNHIEDLGWTIPTEHQTIKMEPTQEVSSVSTTSPKMNSQETQTGMSTQAQTPNTSWFWKVTDMFKAGLSHWMLQLWTSTFKRSLLHLCLNKTQRLIETKSEREGQML